MQTGAPQSLRREHSALRHAAVRCAGGAGVLFVLLVPFGLAGCGGGDTANQDEDESAYEVVEAPSRDTSPSGGAATAHTPARSSTSPASPGDSPPGRNAAPGPVESPSPAQPSIPSAVDPSPSPAVAGSPRQEPSRAAATPSMKASPVAEPDTTRPAARPAPSPSAGSSPTVPKPPSVPANQLNDYRVSGKSPRELMDLVHSIDATLRDLTRSPPRQPEQQRAMMAKIRQTLQAKEEAAGRAFAACDDVKDKELKFEAAQARLQAMMMLANLRDTSVTQRVAAFAKELLASKDERLVTQGRSLSLSLRVADLAAGRKVDLARLLEDYRLALAAERFDPSLGQSVQQTVAVLTSRGHTKESVELLEMAAKAFEKQKEPAVVQLGLNFAHQAEVLKTGLMEKLTAATTDPSAQHDRAFQDAVDQVARLKTPHEAVLFNLTQCLGLLENAGRFDLSRSLCKTIRKLYANHPEERLKRIALGELENVEKRLALLGKPLEVTGMITADGQPFNWAGYEGKVVLFDFWASRNPAWERWTADLKKVYEQYHERGFEVVGVNLDRNRAAAEATWKRAALPWSNTFSANLDRHAMAEKCRVESVPFSMLVDQNGVVIDMFLTPSRLRRRLAELYPKTGPAKGATP